MSCDSEIWRLPAAHFVQDSMKAFPAVMQAVRTASRDPVRVIKFGGSSVGSAEGFIGSSKVCTSPTCRLDSGLSSSPLVFDI